MVRFKHLNLLDADAMRTMTGFDIILCANVLIYFDRNARLRVLDMIHKSLDPNGYLFVGFSETLFGITELFAPIRIDRSMIYVRQDSPAARPTSTQLPFPETSVSTNSAER